MQFCNVHELVGHSLYRFRKAWCWVNSEGVTLWSKPFGKKHWSDRNEAVDVQWNLFMKITSKNCQSARAETCLDNSAWNTVPPQKMEEGNFARISELREASSPFTLNYCARDMYCSCKKPPATLNFWFTTEKAQRGMQIGYVVQCCLCFSRLVLGFSVSTTFEKPENGLYLYDPTRISQKGGKWQGSVSVDCGISTH